MQFLSMILLYRRLCATDCIGLLVELATVSSFSYWWNGWDWGLLGLLLMVIMDHSISFLKGRGIA